jgi:dTDP-4-dehydrorhamnose 3,5-epimerase-like enzyme
MTVEWLGGRVRTIPRQINVDARGSLAIVDFAALQMAAVRSFIVSAPDGTSRGAHGHYCGRQILVAVVGEIDVEMERKGVAETFRLSPTGPAILVEPGVWARQTYRGDGAVLLVLCDTTYDPADYFFDPSETF